MALEIGSSAFEDAGIAMAFVAGREQRSGLGSILIANPAMACFIGRPVTALAGMPFNALLHPEDISSGAEQIDRLRSGELTSCSVEQRFEHADGQPRWGRVTLALPQVSWTGLRDKLIVQVQDITEQKRLLHQLEYVVDHDPLTALCNRRRFLIELERQLAYGHRHGGRGAVLMLDLDRFKEINDQFGHASGDAVLIGVAGALTRCSRQTDVLARLGGDEYAILLPQTSLQEAERHGDRLLQAIHGQAIDGAGNGLCASASCGVAGFRGGDLQTAEDVLINADLALYHAKESGRGCVRVFRSGHGLHAKVQARLLWSERLQQALHHDGFELHARPVRALNGGAVDYRELVIRLRDADGSLVHPSVFLCTADRFGLAGAIDQWVLRRAIALLEHGGAEDPAGLAVNISAASLQSEALINTLRRELAHTRFARHRLIVEVAESVAMANLQRAIDLAHNLRELGCRLALDHFGATFGSVNPLRHLPVDLIKIDAEIVRNLGSEADPTDRLIIETLVRLAQGLGSRVVADGIGDAATRTSLAALGVELGQGSLLGPTIEIRQIGALRTGAARADSPPAPPARCAPLGSRSHARQGAAL